jgi:hypothetical protein
VENKEVSLESFGLLQEPCLADEKVMKMIVSGLSCRNYEACADAVPEAFKLASPKALAPMIAPKTSSGLISK